MTAQFTSDAILISRGVGGDREALDHLIRRYEARFYHYALRLTHNSEEASDVVAEAYIRVFRALSTFKCESAFSTWMYRILTNCFLDMRKKAQRHPTTSLDNPLAIEDDPGWRELADNGRSPYETAERNVRARKVTCAVRLIPKNQESIFSLFHAEELTYDEISRKLGLPIGTVKSRIHRARSSVRSILQPDVELFRAAR
jgi:RNA polymerase sigma-70 factor, ECF subfamily